MNSKDSYIIELIKNKYTFEEIQSALKEKYGHGTSNSKIIKLKEVLINLGDSKLFESVDNIYKTIINLLITYQEKDSIPFNKFKKAISDSHLRVIEAIVYNQELDDIIDKMPLTDENKKNLEYLTKLKSELKKGIHPKSKLEELLK